MVRKGRVVKMIDEEVVGRDYLKMKRVNSYLLKRYHMDHHLLHVKRGILAFGYNIINGG
jgi:hypothetical protein